jgi:acetylglutamate kinase
VKRISRAKGFTFAGIHAGVKNERRDLALILSSLPAKAVAVTTQNQLRAPCVDRVARLVPSEGVRAIVVNSGNANVMGHPQAAEHDARMAAAVAKHLDVSAESVLSASTGTIGKPLPIDLVEGAIPTLIKALGEDPIEAAEAILTTDLVTKLSSRTIETPGGTVRITAIAKGSGMIHPNMATMLGFICTDADCAVEDLQAILKDATAGSFNQISVDRDTSTNDMVVLLANGASGVTIDDETRPAFAQAVAEVSRELARQIAADGEGATRLLSIHVTGAPDTQTARALSRGIVSSNLFKCALFGDSSGWGRCLAAVGAAASELGITLDRRKVSVTVNGVCEVEAGAPTGESGPVNGPEVRFDVELGAGDAEGWAWGCDFSYGYVTINAVSKSEPLETHSPGLKRRLLVECLSYIRQFAGRIAVIKYGGAAMIRDDLKDAFAEDIVLLKAAGLQPVVVHGGGPEISRTLERLGEKTRFVDGIRVTDPSSMKVVEMVLTGSVNTDVVTCGLDLGMVGEVAQVRAEVLHMLLERGYIPVISPIGVDKHGTTYNINADNVACEVAVALKAEKLIFLTDVPGILNGDAIISRTTPTDIQRLIQEGIIKGGMVPKVTAILSAVGRGVQSAHIIDGRVRHNLLAELFTDKGVGSWIRSPEVDPQAALYQKLLFPSDH